MSVKLVLRLLFGLGGVVRGRHFNIVDLNAVGHAVIRLALGVKILDLLFGRRRLGIIIGGGKRHQLGLDRSVLAPEKHFRLLRGGELAAHAHQRHQVFLPDLMPDEAVKILQRNAALLRQLGQRFDYFLRRHSRIGIDAHQAFGIAGGGLRSSDDVIFIEQGVQQQFLPGNLIEFLILCIDIGPLPGIAPEENARLLPGLTHLVRGDGVAIDRAQVISARAAAHKPTAIAGIEVVNKRNNGRCDNYHPEPLLMFANRANHTRCPKFSERAL